MTRIGAILGDGTEKEIELLGHYGRTFGVLMTIRNEFIDVFEADELKNRVENECLPIPILLAFQDKERKTEIHRLLGKKMTSKNIEKILDLSMDCKETRLLVEDMKKWVEEEISLISPLLKLPRRIKATTNSNIRRYLKFTYIFQYFNKTGVKKYCLSGKQKNVFTSIS